MEENVADINFFLYLCNHKQASADSPLKRMHTPFPTPLPHCQVLESQARKKRLTPTIPGG